MIVEAVSTETAAIREASYLRTRFETSGVSSLANVVAADLAETLIDLAGGRDDVFSIKAASATLFAMDERERIEAVAGLAEDDPKSYLAACLAA